MACVDATSPPNCDTAPKGAAVMTKKHCSVYAKVTCHGSGTLSSSLSTGCVCPESLYSSSACSLGPQ